MSEPIEIECLMTPEFEQLEARYNSIVKEIYAEASEQMIGATPRAQALIHRCAMENARPWVEELGRLRSRLLTRVTIPSDFEIKYDPKNESMNTGSKSELIAALNAPERETDTQT